MRKTALIAIFILAALALPAWAQTAADQTALATLADTPSLKKIPAKKLFGSMKLPADLKSKPSDSTPKGAWPAARPFPPMVRLGR
jgi:hypothetical protein